ncbi:MAG: hypothetical protein KGI54_15565 [Pseudomonadota bacterium]|nr:hypothetical protein [Pseudomonadota bacterium]
MKRNTSNSSKEIKKAMIEFFVAFNDATLAKRNEINYLVKALTGLADSRIHLASAKIRSLIIKPVVFYQA